MKKAIVRFSLLPLALFTGCAELPELSKVPDLRKHLPEFADVYGPSMEPVYPPGTSWKINKALSYKDVKLGFICVYINESPLATNNPFMHKVVGGRSGYWIMQGLNASRPDTWYMTERDYICTVEPFISRQKTVEAHGLNDMKMASQEKHYFR